MVDAEAVFDVLLAADAVDFQGELDWHAVAGGVAVAFDPEALDFFGGVGPALAAEGVVVEVGSGGAHCAEGEGDAAGVLLGGAFYVVGEDDAGGDFEVDVVERAAGALGAGADVVEEDIGGFGDEAGAEPAVGDFAAEFEAAASERGEVDGRGLAGGRAGADRFAFAARQGQGVVPSFVDETLAVADFAHDFGGFGEAADCAGEGHAVPAFDDLRAAGAEPQPEASAGH